MSSLVLFLDSNVGSINLFVLGLKPLLVDFIQSCECESEYLEKPFLQVIESLKKGENRVKDGLFKNCQVILPSKGLSILESPVFSVKYQIV